MTQFYFHVTSNGQLVRDAQGHTFDGLPQACQHAISRTPGLLADALGNPNTYVTTEICDDAGTICVVRATIILEHRKK